ncbi:MAG TPA: hypothetical protein VMN79_12515 [Casimicrobiaceae bacterium]|nr:hypothetical protein [Casimicrobiaceae bacterium]
MTQAAPDPVADELLRRLPASPDAYLQKLDLVALTVLLVEFGAAQYRSASFLDDRILGPTTKGAWLPLDRIDEGSRRVVDPRPLHYIFHTGHVGSTLVSRVLDETGVVLSLREPLPLRTLADAHDALGRSDSLLTGPQFDSILGALTRLWSRGYDATRSVVVKATSSAGRLAPALLDRREGSRAIYLNLRAEPYLATLLAGRNSPLDLRGHGAERMRRLAASVAAPVAPLHAMSLGELAAMSWLVESRAQRAAALRYPGRVLPVDFEAFISAAADGTRRVLAHFELPPDERFLSAIGRSAALNRYSKAPEYAYTPELRAEVLRESRRQNRDEIARGMQWLERLARSDAAVAEVLSG